MPDLKVIRCHNRVEDVLAARQARETKTQELGLTSPHFLLTGLPMRPTEETTVYRTNGHASIKVHAGPDGMPFGQDRLLIMWLATAFTVLGKPEDRTIRFASMLDIPKAFGDMQKGTLMRQQWTSRIKRVFGFHYEWRHEKDGKIRMLRRQLIESVRMHVLGDVVPHRHSKRGPWSQSITLDAGWAAELRAGHSVPLDLESVRALRGTPGALDLYLWQSWRSWRHRGRKQPASIPVFGSGGLCAQFGVETNSIKDAKKRLRAWQDRVRQVWPECPNELSHDAEYFLIGGGEAIPPTRNYMTLPGVKKAPPWVIEAEQHESPETDDDLHPAS